MSQVRGKRGFVERSRGKKEGDPVSTPGIEIETVIINNTIIHNT